MPIRQLGISDILGLHMEFNNVLTIIRLSVNIKQLSQLLLFKLAI